MTSEVAHLWTFDKISFSTEIPTNGSRKINKQTKKDKIRWFSLAVTGSENKYFAESYTERNFQRKVWDCAIGMGPKFVSTLCAIRYETSTFLSMPCMVSLIIRCQIWLHFMQNGMKYKKINFLLRWKFLPTQKEIHFFIFIFQLIFYSSYASKVSDPLLQPVFLLWTNV